MRQTHNEERRRWIGARIRAARICANLLPYNLASQSDGLLSCERVRQLERGERDAHASELHILGKVCRVPVSYFLPVNQFKQRSK